MKGFGFKQLKRKEGPSFYLSGFKEKRKRVNHNAKATTNQIFSVSSPCPIMTEIQYPDADMVVSDI